MKILLQVKFRDMPFSEAIEAKINEKAAKLDRFNDRIMACRVVVEETQKKQRQGRLFSVHIDLTVPGRELAITKQENTDVYVAIRDAFDAAVRLLDGLEEQHRGVVKFHTPLPSGRVVRIFPESDFGYIRTADDREIYFHRNSVLDNRDFGSLKFGTEVTFIEEQGNEGPQAARVTVVRR